MYCTFFSNTNMEKNDPRVSGFLSGLEKWNRRINLVSKNDIPRLYERHFTDSLVAEKYISKNATVLDIGSGNGFPAIPIALSRNDLQIVAMEKNVKKGYFLKRMKEGLHISNLSIFIGKIEEEPNEYKKHFDYCLSRAFSSTEEIVKKAIYYLKNNGKIIIFKSFIDNDIDGLSTMVGKLINSVDNVVYKNTSGEKRKLVILKTKTLI
ncbi:MAG: 16S rRNA (guanine(527)-N(7))-methyltransferase RsmG [Candidatus Raymondbacteria bacterium RifOxyB12_full_50_8]|uniref:Ribosomal RNA small subunit methyltransferase G n=1 Tax=Candidatus Raymondbacteria bacterium RIFOXYD12_FULL_49_13 TaxID=1817890 RepID=A0A1F7FFT1_UNCRA|nr:MAG: 16S rRNA (guanine(527)-N(7))-methyltransferase RsmG [Candidatus Raymondbacteria bacterium RifOxyB12_full_50_8]OGK05357.1 MAG: 16S rRNA (guanine(527)-N(7))-methyltransferase RsmG [Candidatus Raymondbacteria bacterium RIFOXYD12_FULL_49_13]